MSKKNRAQKFLKSVFVWKFQRFFEFSHSDGVLKQFAIGTTCKNQGNIKIKENKKKSHIYNISKN